jgi:nucleotide-binding universal stress UspA family protein
MRPQLPQETAAMFKRILLPTDGSELSGKAATMAIALAKTHGAVLVALHVFPHLPGAHHGAAAPFLKQLEGGYEKGQSAEAKEMLKAIADEAAAAGVATETVVIESEDIHSRIIEVAAQRGCDLICMATHGRSELAAVVLGSVTHKVLTGSPVPVLVVR